MKRKYRNNLSEECKPKRWKGILNPWAQLLKTCEADVTTG